MHRFYGAMEWSQASYDFISHSLIMRRSATADERSVEANIFASARNTVRIRRRLQRIGIQSSAAASAVRDITTYKCLQLSLERQVAVETWRVRAVNVKQWVQRPTTDY